MPAHTDGSLAIFVASSDNTRDVFAAVAPAFNVYWPSCPYPKYVGLNSPPGEEAVTGFIPVYAPPLGWRDELRAQLSQLSEEFVLLWLDDFLLLAPVDTARVERLRLLAVEKSFDYLRLIEIERSVLVKLFARLSAMFLNREYVPIPTGIPYYSSLQAAIWRRKHLLDMLDSYGEQRIWEFEHQALRERQHFAIVGSPPILYRHLVEKGKWLPYAAGLLKTAGLAFPRGRRSVWPSSYRLLHWRKKLIFALIGYTGMRAKRMLRR